MSVPVTDQEREQAGRTLDLAGMAENLVSTACPKCGVRFAMLAKLDAAGWHLRCTACGHRTEGELK